MKKGETSRWADGWKQDPNGDPSTPSPDTPVPGKETASEGGQHSLLPCHVPRETPGLCGARLAATKANWKEKQIGDACYALVQVFVSSCGHLAPLSCTLPWSWLLRLLLHVSLPSPVTQSAKLLLERENNYCLPHHPDVSDAMIKYFARPHPLSV